MDKSASDRRMIEALEDMYQIDQLVERETVNRSWGAADSMRHESAAISRMMAEDEWHELAEQVAIGRGIAKTDSVSR